MGNDNRALERLSFPIQYLEIGESLLRARGLDVAGFYQLCGVSAPDAIHPAQTINGLQMRTALQLFLNVCAPHPAPLVQIMQHFPLTMHGALGVMALTSDTLGKALDSALEFAALVMPAFEIHREDHGRHVHLVFKSRYDFAPVNEFFTELVMAAFMQIRPFMATAPSTISMQYRHAPLGKAEDYDFGEEVKFSFNGNLDQVVLNAEDLAIRLLAPSRNSRQMMQTTLEQQRLQQLGKHPTVQQVKRLLQQALHENRLLDAGQIADKLNISARTLSRRLKEEESSLPLLQAEVGLDFAELLLVKSDRNIAEIARIAGFQDATSFSRAFKRMKGKTPSQFRSKSPDAD